MFPRRFAHVPGIPALPGPWPKGWHWAAMAAVACGKMKQLGLREMGPLGFFLKLESTGLHPDTKLGTNPVSSSFVPTGSPPKIGVNGCPVLALYRATSCHPPNAHSGSLEPFCGPGTSHVALTTSVCATLKSESPRVVR